MWQDWWFALAGCLYTLVLLPSCFDPGTEMPRASSVMTASIMTVSGSVYGTMDMWAAGATMWIGALPWVFLAWRRPRV